jgi:hypothetical protein
VVDNASKGDDARVPRERFGDWFQGIGMIIIKVLWKPIIWV